MRVVPREADLHQQVVLRRHVVSRLQRISDECAPGWTTSALEGVAHADCSCGLLLGCMTLWTNSVCYVQHTGVRIPDHASQTA